MPTLPNVTSKFIFDYSDLTKAEKASARAHGEFARGAKESTTHTLRFEQSLTTLMDHFGGMPPIVNQAGRSIESMASQGVTGMGLVGGAALVAAGAVAEVVGQSIKGYQDLGEKVENYRRVVGASAEESSRMVYVFEALGAGEETATQGMFKLSKAIETAPKKLEDLGIVVQRNAAGNIDLNKTLFQVADAYNATGDQAKKNLILFEAFGKTGKDMIPILEQGSTSLQQMESSASLLFSEADLERLKQAKIHTQELKTAWDEWWAAHVGQPAENAKASFAENMLAMSYAQKRYQEDLANGTVKAQVSASAMESLNRKYVDEYYATQKAKEGLDAQAQATNDAAAANEALWNSTDRLINQQEAQVNAGEALQLANLAIAESQGKVDLANQRVKDSANAVDAARDAWNAAKAKYGKNSEEAAVAGEALNKAMLEQTQIANDVTKAQIEQEKAYYAGAAAARKLQEETDLATTGQKDARKEAQAYIDQLQAEADTLSPNSPLRKNLQAYIDQLTNELPRDVTTTVRLLTPGQEAKRAAGGHGTLTGYASGGRPEVGVPAVFGENGPEIWTPDRPGTVTPHGGTPPSGNPDQQSGDTWIQLSQDQPIVLDGAVVGRVMDQRVARAMQRMGVG